MQNDLVSGKLIKNFVRYVDKEKIVRTIEIPKHTIIKYIRYNNGDPRGVLVGIKTKNGFSIGYSLCNKQDKFSKDMALKIAIGRAAQCVPERSFPHIISKNLNEFVDRCKKYYKYAG